MVNVPVSPYPIGGKDDQVKVSLEDSENPQKFLSVEPPLFFHKCFAITTLSQSARVRKKNICRNCKVAGIEQKFPLQMILVPLVLATILAVVAQVQSAGPARPPQKPGRFLSLPVPQKCANSKYSQLR